MLALFPTIPTNSLRFRPITDAITDDVHSCKGVAGIWMDIALGGREARVAHDFLDDRRPHFCESERRGRGMAAGIYG